MNIFSLSNHVGSSIPMIHMLHDLYIEDFLWHLNHWVDQDTPHCGSREDDAIILSHVNRISIHKSS